MISVFKDKSTQKTFSKNGYVLLKNLLNQEDLHLLQNILDKHKSNFEESFHTSHFSTDKKYKQEAHDIISEVVFAKIKEHLNNYVPLFGNFMIKNPNQIDGLDLHADWTYVDETKYESIAAWIPLINVNKKNGCFGLIEGSHKITNIIRGPLIRQSTRNNDKVWEENYGKLIEMNAGDAIIYNHRLLHYSPPNTTEAIRPAVNLSMAPNHIEWIHYCMPLSCDYIQKYKVTDSSFFINYNHFQVPESQSLIGTLPVNSVSYIDFRMNSFRKILCLNRVVSGVKSLLNFPHNPV